MSGMAARFDAIGIVVTDMARSLEFYRLLGLEFPDGAEDESHVESETPNGTRLMLDTLELMKSIDEGFTLPADRSGFVIAFLCDSPGEVDALHGRVVDSGFQSKLEPFDAFWGQRYATVLDPDGTHVDLFATLEAA